MANKKTVEPKEGQRLILNDGTIIEDGQCGYADGNLWCYMTGYTIQQAASMFLYPENTEHIEFQFGEMSDSYDGFTNCTCLMAESGGRVSVCIVRGEQNATS